MYVDTHVSATHLKLTASKNIAKLLINHKQKTHSTWRIIFELILNNHKYYVHGRPFKPLNKNNRKQLNLNRIGNSFGQERDREKDVFKNIHNRKSKMNNEVNATMENYISYLMNVLIVWKTYKGSFTPQTQKCLFNFYLKYNIIWISPFYF